MGGEGGLPRRRSRLEGGWVVVEVRGGSCISRTRLDAPANKRCFVLSEILENTFDKIWKIV